MQLLSTMFLSALLRPSSALQERLLEHPLPDLISYEPTTTVHKAEILSTLYITGLRKYSFVFY